MLRLSHAAVVLFVAVAIACRAKPAPPAPASDFKPPPPVVDGAMSAAGLHGIVTIVRDRWGVPHISATDTHDLFFAQGFVQAQDRLFQIDVWRRAAQGRLAEVLGANFIERDAMTRRMQYRGPMAAEWESYGPEAREIATAFVDGINAWIEHTSTHLPPEFALAGWTPEKWRAEDLLNRTESFVLSGGAREEVWRARLIAHLDVATVDRLLPLSEGRPTQVSPPTRVSPRVDLDAITSVVADTIARAGTPPFFSGLAAPLSAGSNAWAIRQTDDHGAVVAVDPHRPFDNPSFRYLVHLSAPGWNVFGATAPWRPGVAIGHNDRVAWGFAAKSIDTQDIFVEQTNPRNPREVRRGARWVPMEVEHDSVAVKGRSEPFEYDRLYTSNGVVIGLDSERQLAYVLRWTGTAPGAAAEMGALVLDRASSASEFGRALSAWKVPAAEFVFADRGGAIGRHVAALVPRRRGMQGATPAAAWTNVERWDGIEPASSGDGPMTEPFALSVNDNVDRATRGTQVLSQHTDDPVEQSRRLQLDVQASGIEGLRTLLTSINSADATADAGRRELLEWNGQVAQDSPAAALYVEWERAMARALAAARVPPEFVDYVAERLHPAQIVITPDPFWFGDDPTSNRERMIFDALKTALAQRARAEAKDSRALLGTTTFAHPLALSEAGRRRFNVGPFAIPGYAETMRAVSADRKVGASFRAIFDVVAWDRSIATAAPGQSEAGGSPHFGDLAALWAADSYFPLAFSEAAVQATRESTLTLTPPR